MAIGDTVQAGLGRMDFSVFQTAGAAQARANEAFGNALGQAATAYFKGKEKKERANEMTQYLMGQGASEEDAKAIAKNPFLQNEYQRKQAADQQMDIAKLRVAAQRAEGGANRAQVAAKMETEERLRNEQKEGEREMDNIFLMANAPSYTDDYGQFNQDTGNRAIDQSSPEAFLKTINEAGLMPQTDAGRGMLADELQRMRLASITDPADLYKLREELRKTALFDQGQNAISFSPDRNILQLGDTEFGISGKFGNEAEVIKLKSEAIPQYQNMNAVMNDLIELGEKRKNEVFMSNADKTLAASLSRQLQGLLREDILGPGTVTEPERQILEQIVQNPTTWMDFAGKTQDKINSLKGIRRNAFNKLKTRLTGLGLDVAEFGQSKSPAQNFDKQTSTGLGFTEIDLDQL